MPSVRFFAADDRNDCYQAFGAEAIVVANLLDLRPEMKTDHLVCYEEAVVKVPATAVKDVLAKLIKAGCEVAFIGVLSP